MSDDDDRRVLALVEEGGVLWPAYRDAINQLESAKLTAAPFLVSIDDIDPRTDEQLRESARLLTQKTSAWTDEERHEIDAQRTRDNAEAYSDHVLWPTPPPVKR